MGYWWAPYCYIQALWCTKSLYLAHLWHDNWFICCSAGQRHFFCPILWKRKRVIVISITHILHFQCDWLKFTQGQNQNNASQWLPPGLAWGQGCIWQRVPHCCFGFACSLAYSRDTLLATLKALSSFILQLQYALSWKVFHWLYHFNSALGRLSGHSQGYHGYLFLPLWSLPGWV